MKKITALLLGLIMAVSVAGCDRAPDEDSRNNRQPQQSEGSGSSDTAPGGEDTSQPPVHGGEPASATIVSASARDVVAGITAGWNLGNTFDARTDSETGWISHPTNQGNIRTIAAAGFDAIRIPVTWTVDEQFTLNKAAEDNDWTISPRFLNRVEEVVRWAYDEGMTVIINSHHDDAVQLTMLSDPARSDMIHRRIWEQVAGHFNNQFGERLIFAGSNEPRARLNDFGEGSPEVHAAINRQHQIFVDTVRASGGNNTYRSLIIMGHAASALEGALEGLSLPNDPTPNRLILAAHTYSPYNFAFRRGSVSNFRPEATRDNSEMHGNPGGWWHHDTPERILNYFDQIQTHAQRLNLPVLLTEWGSQDNNNTSARAAHAEYYVREAARRGWRTFWWDNMQTYGGGNEYFGLLDRHTDTWFFPEVVDAIMRGAR
jgi:aryl-phospho-beta-D-glucosidase BglC (GH1 family)